MPGEHSALMEQTSFELIALTVKGSSVATPASLSPSVATPAPIAVEGFSMATPAHLTVKGSSVATAAPLTVKGPLWLLQPPSL